MQSSEAATFLELSLKYAAAIVFDDTSSFLEVHGRRYPLRTGI
jgi:hypothetical protein